MCVPVLVNVGVGTVQPLGLAMLTVTEDDGNALNRPQIRHACTHTHTHLMLIVDMGDVPAQTHMNTLAHLSTHTRRLISGVRQHSHRFQCGAAGRVAVRKTRAVVGAVLYRDTPG